MITLTKEEFDNLNYYEPTTLTCTDNTFNTLYDPYRPMKPYSDITIILDRSGSMEGIDGAVRKSTISGFNEFVGSQQKLEGKALISLVQFDDDYEEVYKSLPIGSAKKLTNKTFKPRGMTALNDAIGRTIDSIGRRLAAMPISQRPNNVIIAIITDGFENASTDYTKSRIAEMIKHQQNKYNWTFMFIGANQDAILSGREYNIPAAYSINYTQSKAGITGAFSAASCVVTSSRLGNVEGFSDSMRKEAMEEDAV